MQHLTCPIQVLTVRISPRPVQPGPSPSPWPGHSARQRLQPDLLYRQSLRCIPARFLSAHGKQNRKKDSLASCVCFFRFVFLFVASTGASLVHRISSSIVKLASFQSNRFFCARREKKSCALADLIPSTPSSFQSLLGVTHAI